MAILARRNGSRRRMLADINVVPYIDVMLVLVVILMVAAPFVNPALVNLPSVAKSSRAHDRPLEVVIRASGSLLLREGSKEVAADLPGAIDAIRACVAAAGPVLSDAGVEVEDAQVRANFDSADAREGVAAFLEKRPARFGSR